MRFAGPSARYIALMLGSVHVVSFYYSQEFRVYSLFELASALNLYFFLNLNTSRTRSYNWLFSSIFMISVHQIGMVPVFVQIFWIATNYLDVNRKRELGRFLVDLFLLVLISGLTLMNIKWWSLNHISGKGIPLIFKNYAVLRFLSGFYIFTAAVNLYALYTSRKRYPALVFIAVVSLLTPTLCWLLLGINLLIDKYFIFLIPYFVTAVSFTFSRQRHFVSKLIITLYVSLNLLDIGHFYLKPKTVFPELLDIVNDMRIDYVTICQHRSASFPYFSGIRHDTFCSVDHLKQIEYEKASPQRVILIKVKNSQYYDERIKAIQKYYESRFYKIVERKTLTTSVYRSREMEYTIYEKR
jgi:hypothetical protein